MHSINLRFTYLLTYLLTTSRPTCRYAMTLVERCYDDIDVMTRCSAVAAEFADVVVDTSTCVILRDVTVLRDMHLSQTLALSISSFAAKYLRCCVILTPPPQHNNLASHLSDPACHRSAAVYRLYG